MITHSKTYASAANNYWLWIALIELAAIGYLSYQLLNKQKITAPPSATDGELLSEAKSATIDMNNVINDINNSRNLYKKLSRKCHPDLFATDEKKRKVADELFQEITKSQRDYKRLLELQELANQKLNITL